MRNKQTRLIALALTVILVTATRCGGGTAKHAAFDIDHAATQTGTALLRVTPPPTAAEARPFRGLDVAAFASYEMSMHIKVKDAEGADVTTIRLEVQARANAAIQRMTRTGVLVPNEATITTIYLDGMTYHTDGVHCDTTRGDAEALLAVGPGIAEQLHIFDPSTLSYVGPGGTVNGVATLQYHTALQHPDLSEGSADVWLATDAGHLVRWRMSGRGDLSAFEFGVATGVLTMEFNLLSTNRPLDIQVPPECGAREPVPPSAG